MLGRRVIIIGAVLLSFSATGAAFAQGKAKSAQKRVKKGRGGRFAGHLVPESALRQAPLERPSGHIVVRSPALHEDLDVQIYNADGSFNQDALAKLDHLFRCRRERHGPSHDERPR